MSYFAVARGGWGVLRDFGTFGAAVRVTALRFGNKLALVDDRGELSYTLFDRQIEQLAVGLLREIGPGSTVGVLCRNHRGPLLAAFGAVRAGLTCVWMNPDFTPRQAAEIAHRAGIQLLIHDYELEHVAEAMLAPCRRIDSEFGIDSLIDLAGNSPLRRPVQDGKLMLCNSVTSGAVNRAPQLLTHAFPGVFFNRIPLGRHGTFIIVPPLLDGSTLSMTLMAIGLGGRIIMRRRYDPLQALDDIVRYRANVVCLDPALIQRTLELPEKKIARHDLSSLRAVITGGAILSADIVASAQRLLGSVLYVAYGCNELPIATVATPADIASAPNSAGRPIPGCRVRILDDDSIEVARGAMGRIFIGGPWPLTRHSEGEGKPSIRGLIATGDAGYVDHHNRLFVVGRMDDANAAR